MTPEEIAAYKSEAERTAIYELSKTMVHTSAVQMMCMTMADNKTEELSAARSGVRESIIDGLQSFCDSPLSEVEKSDVSGVLRAIEIVRRLA